MCDHIVLFEIEPWHLHMLGKLTDTISSPQTWNYSHNVFTENTMVCP